MKEFEMTTKKTGIAALCVALTCLAQSPAAAQTGNPWNRNSVSGGASGNATSRYAPADLARRLSAVRPVAPLAVPAPTAPVQLAPAPQHAAPVATPQYAPAPITRPVQNGYPTGGYTPGTGYGYAGVPQGYSGYAPNYGATAYPNYGNGYSGVPGGYPGSNGGFFPSGGFLPGGNSPFGFSPFGFF
jgi:hypothetical protein